MCEAYFKTLAGEIEVSSAGVYAFDGDFASEHAAEVAAEFGGDLRGFRSRKLRPGMIEEADLIVTMGRAHRAGVLELSPGAEAKTVLLLGDRDVGDPFGGSLAVYRRCFEEMKIALDKLHKTLT